MLLRYEAIQQHKNRAGRTKRLYRVNGNIPLNVEIYSDFIYIWAAFIKSDGSLS